MLNVVLVEPEIPMNTGNIARTCAATGSRLHLIRPLGFEITDSRVKRAGLDYWHMVNITYYNSFEHFLGLNPAGDKWFFSTKAEKLYCDAAFADGCFLIFGKETAGLPEDILEPNFAHALRIPMVSGARSLNLANSAAVGVYEALRRIGFG